MGKRTSYAKAMEQISAKRGKYEKQLEDALRTGDRFGINSAERSIERIKSFEQELFNSQEQQKIDKGITPPQPQGMPMFNVGGPFYTSNSYSNPDLPSDAQLAQMNRGELENLFRSFKANPNLNTYAKDKRLSTIRGYLNTVDSRADKIDSYRNTTFADALQSQPFNLVNLPSGFNQTTEVPAEETATTATTATTGTTGTTGTSTPKTREVIDPVTGLTPKAIPSITEGYQSQIPVPGGAELIRTPLVQSPLTLNPDSATMPTSRLGEGLKTGLNAAGKVAPYALQFAPDLIALRQLNKLQRPEDMPMEQVTQMNTDVDTSATIARIKDNAMAFNAGVDSGMSNSAAVQNVKLAQLAQTNKQLADVGQQEENTERELRNQQAALATGTFNRNLVTDRNNRQQLADFDNMITNARLGIVQGMGTKAFQMLQEKNQIDLDKDRLDTLKRQFDPGLIQRNFQNILKDDPTAMAETDLQSLAASIKQYPSLGDQLKIDNPKLYDAIIKLG